jgi:hypothetical protein
MSGLSIVSLSVIFLLDFGTVPGHYFLPTVRSANRGDTTLSALEFYILKHRYSHTDPLPTELSRDLSYSLKVSVLIVYLIKWKTKYTTLLEQFHNPKEKSQKETQSIILTHKYMTCLSTDTSIKSGGVKLVVWAQTSPLSEMTDAVMQVLSPYERFKIVFLFFFLFVLSSTSFAINAIYSVIIQFNNLY